MAVTTRVDGSASGPLDVARWLRGPLAQALESHTSTVTLVRADVRGDWDGNASEACASALTAMVSSADATLETVHRLADLLEQHADAVLAAQRTMVVLRAEASAAGLRLTPDRILRPEPGDPAAAVYSDVSRRAESVLSEVAGSGQRVLDALLGALTSWKSYASGAALGAGVAFERHLQGARRHVTNLQVEAQRAEDAYLASPGGSAEARFQERRRYDLMEDVAVAQREADELAGGRLARLVGGRLPVLGGAVTVAGVGYDVHSGADPSDAVVGAVAGAVASAVAVTLIGGPVLLVAAAGVGAGILGGLVAETIWNNVVPDEFRAKVDRGLRDLWEAAARGVDDLWGAIF
jgi:hypothetical protein